MPQTRVVSFSHFTSFTVLRLELSHSRLLLRFSLQLAVSHTNHQSKPHRAPHLVGQTENKTYLHGSSNCLSKSSIRIPLLAAFLEQDGLLVSVVNIPEAGVPEKHLSDDGRGDGEQGQKGKHRDNFSERVISHEFEGRP